MTNRFEAGTDCIFDRERGTASMGDDARSVDAEERHAAVFVGVGFLFDAAERVPSEPRASHTNGALFQFAFEPPENGVGDGLYRLQHDVPDETVADNDLDGIFEKVVSLDISAEVESACAKEFKCFPSELVALFVFGADGDESDRGVGVAEDVTGVGGAHDCVLYQLPRGGVGVGSGVDEDEVVGFGGDDGADGGALDAWEGAQLDVRGRDGSPRVSGADDGVCLARFDEVDGAADGRIALSSDGIGGGVGHFDHLSGVNDFDA